MDARRLFRKSGKFSRARQCLESGFRYLFLLEEDQTNDLRRLYSASVAKEEEVITTLSRLPTLLGWRLPEACGEEGNSNIIHCHKALCMSLYHYSSFFFSSYDIYLIFFASVSNSTTWCAFMKGWQCPHFRDCEAEILSECGNLILAEEDDRRVTHPYHSSQYPSQAPELFHMAIAVYPNHAQSLLALAHYELGRQRALSSPNERYVPSVTLLSNSYQRRSLPDSLSFKQRRGIASCAVGISLRVICNAATRFTCRWLASVRFGVAGVE